jgi:hypothetical protein
MTPAVLTQTYIRIISVEVTEAPQVLYSELLRDQDRVLDMFLLGNYLAGHDELQSESFGLPRPLDELRVVRVQYGSPLEILFTSLPSIYPMIAAGMTSVGALA